MEFFTILFTGIVTFFANYLSMSKITDATKQRIAEGLFFVINLLNMVLIVYSIIYFLIGLFGIGGIHAWMLSLYDYEDNIMFTKGLRFADRMEPFIFIVRGMICLVIPLILIKFIIPRIRKKKHEVK